MSITPAGEKMYHTCIIGQKNAIFIKLFYLIDAFEGGIILTDEAGRKSGCIITVFNKPHVHGCI